MKRDGLRAADLARAANATRGAVGRWLKGENFPEAPFIDRLMEKTGWTLPELFNPDPTSIANTKQVHIKEVTLQEAIQILNAQLKTINLELKKTRRPNGGSRP